MNSDINILTQIFLTFHVSFYVFLLNRYIITDSLLYCHFCKLHS